MKMILSYMIIGFMLIGIVNFVVADSDLYQVCGGDDELIIQCFGDSELNSLGYKSITSPSLDSGGGVPETTKGQRFIFNWLFIFLLLITLCFILILAKRRKKDKEE